MPAKSKPPQNKTSPVVLLFTLGVVGWGFFAIDRLTAPLNQKWEARNIESPAIEKTPSLKQWLLNWIRQDSAVSTKPSLASVKIFLYKLNAKGETELATVKRTFSWSQGKQDTLKQIFHALIAGPTPEELAQDYMDAFPDKPKLHRVLRQGKTLVLDFQEDFGEGSSFELIKLQLRLFLKTAQSLPGIENIKITVQGVPVTHLGGDGFPIPSVIRNI